VSATLIDESALPTVTPTVAAVNDSATALRTSTDAVRQAAQAAQRSWSGIDGVLSSPGATDALSDAMSAATGPADGLATAAGSVATALETFADDLTTIRRTRRSLLADIEELRARVAASDSDDAVPDEYRAANDDLHARASRLHTRWRTAQDDLAQAIRGQIGGAPRLFPTLGGSMLAAPFARIDFGAASRAFRDAGRLPLLAGLAAQGPDALRKWAADHPGEAQRLLDHPPSTDDVKAWWTGLDADDRTALVTGLSTVVGNLGGVLYADRGRANQHTLDTELPKAQARYRELSGKVFRNDELTPAERAEYARLSEIVGSLEALDKTLLAGTASAPRTIVSLTLGHPPLAAVAIGDLDTATNVTVNVPGMGNTVAESMQGWAGGAENLLMEQKNAAARAKADQNLATVAWIGYDTPEMPPSVDVLGSAKAEVGARNLSGFLEGVSGTRGWKDGNHLSVVAHSYGTTTATLAVAKTPVANLTLLASAGVDMRVPNVQAVDVPADHVWASQASKDYVANIGRGSVEAPGLGFGGDQPINTWNPFTANRSHVIALPSTHPLNPGDGVWGARTFSSDTQMIDGRVWHGSDGHGATPATEAAIKGESRKDEDHGYLDAGTTPLRNTAYTSLGYTPEGKEIR
jgi:hypothetical protein